MQWKLGDNWNGTQTWAKEEDGVLYTSDVQSGKTIQAILDENHRRRQLGRKPNSLARGRLVASVPATVHYEWVKDWKTRHRDKWTWETYVAMKLNDRNYKYLRTTEGRV